ncbi:MAG: hypothetical protein R2883_08220 [Caldisericia bacterium]
MDEVGVKEAIVDDSITGITLTPLYDENSIVERYGRESLVELQPKT